ncbi:sensor histidine kinase [Ornithinimicrobium flavum]|uniref:sensor histidine kinase n=1 Tax=Ornithinimicrobium flavum TaxID=1288636 RepID=UPI00106FCEEB|nr:HAMP domain-containing sensor histidine kinase [Ornithinimicrobium flavum]
MSRWRSLRTRLVLSHVLVALASGLVTAVVVRLVALQRWDRVSGMPGGARHGGPAAPGGMAGFRAEFVDSVDRAVLAGVVVGLLAAVGLGVLAARRTALPLEQLRSVTRELSLGRYSVRVPRPTTTELADLADDVRRLGERLGETEARRARLIGEVAHEMRTPLTVTRGYAEAMLDGVVPADEVGLGKVIDQTRRLERLAEDLSSLSRAEEGRMDVRTVPDADLGVTVRGAVAAVQATAAARQVHLCTTAPASLPLPHDPDRIAQVVTNLLTNAVRASGAGDTVDVRVTAGDPAVVDVLDRGVGLQPGEEEAVFERFYRGDRSGQDDGSGIGLTIARALARAHGGDLVASSAGPGTGARFRLTLPAGGLSGAGASAT